LNHRLARRQGSRRLEAVCPDGVSRSLTFDQRVISASVSRRSPGELVAPGFIDLQVNGAFGFDVMSASAADLLEISRRLTLEGTSAWLPTVITAPLDRIERIDSIIAEAIAAQRELTRSANASPSAAILGMHLEGPFISPRRLGAHPPANLPLSTDALSRILGLKTLRLITLAPELEGGLEAIRQLTSHGITVSIGHTDATYEQAMAAVKAGARMFTHVFNGMAPLHHRSPGAAGAAMTDSPARAALIPDKVHVHPAMLRAAWRSREARGTIFVTDRVALAGAGRRDRPPIFGRTANGADSTHGAVRLTDGTLAGSTISMLDAARVMRRCADVDLAGIVAATSYNPAHLLKLRARGSVLPRSRADLLLLDRHLNLKAVFIGGREVQ
jgi:N-acetylglucosamine-6-phosphate deacetylase